MKAPVEQFMEQALKDFEQHLKNQGLKSGPNGPVEQRVRGAREFALFLLGRPHQKREVTKGRI